MAGFYADMFHEMRFLSVHRDTETRLLHIEDSYAPECVSSKKNCFNVVDVLRLWLYCLIRTSWEECM